MRGVCVPTGKHEVVFSFDPPIVRYGIAVSRIGMGVLLIAAVWVLWEGRHDGRRGGVHNTASGRA